MKKFLLNILFISLFPCLGLSAHTEGPNILITNKTDLNAYAIASKWDVTALKLFPEPVLPKSDSPVGVGYFDDQSKTWDISFFIKLGDDLLTVRNSVLVHATQSSIKYGAYINLDDGRCYRVFAEWSMDPLMLTLQPCNTNKRK